jgi:hypothetical protein
VAPEDGTLEAGSSAGGLPWGGPAGGPLEGTASPGEAVISGAGGPAATGNNSEIGGRGDWV